jgi:hypothetical protein
MNSLACNYILNALSKCVILQGIDASKPAGNRFHLLIALFTKEYLPTSDLCSLALFFWLWSSLHAHVYTVLRVSYIYVHIFVWEGTEHSVICSHVPVQLPLYVDVTLWSCAVLCLLMFRIAAISHISYINHFTASHQHSQNTERIRSSAGTEQLVTEERSSTVRTARCATRQLHDRATA